MSLRPSLGLNLLSAHDRGQSAIAPRRPPSGAPPDRTLMDLWIVAAIAMLLVWALGTFAFAGPGWLHLLLTLGVFIVIWRIVVRGTPPAR